MSMEYSRGCPFNCEFCDIIEMFGRVPRVKSPPQVLRELDAVRATGWRGSVFFFDDNFIANRREVAVLLPEVERWQEAHGRPFEFYTEASVDLATQEKLIASMVKAGFTTVFLGIETPSPEALRETQKLQNLRIELHEAVHRITRAGHPPRRPAQAAAHRAAAWRTLAAARPLLAAGGEGVAAAAHAQARGGAVGARRALHPLHQRRSAAAHRQRARPGCAPACPRTAVGGPGGAGGPGGGGGFLWGGGPGGARAPPSRRAAELRAPRAAGVDQTSASGYFFPRQYLVGVGVTFSTETFHGSPNVA